MKKILILIFSLFIAMLGHSQTTTVATGGTGSFIVPCGVTTLTIELWGAGAGGGGGNGSNKDAGGGGGGGGYSKFNSIAVTPGTTYNYTVGVGGPGGVSGNAAGGTNGGFSQIIIGATTYSANGGTKGNRASSGAGGAGGVIVAAASVKFAGGAGATGNSGTGSGGGGEGAGSTAAGANGAVTAGGATVATGGDGGNGGGSNTVIGGAGNGPGGGGAGGSKGGNGGSGADGQMILSYNGVATDAGVDQNRFCSATTATLSGNTVAGNTGAWTCVTGCGSAVITTPTSASSGVTGLTVGTATTFRWTLTSGGCSTSDDVIITPSASCPPCGSAPVLTIDAALLCGQTTNGSTSVNGECLIYGVGLSETKYYRFTATNDSLVVNVDMTSNPANITPIVQVYGPFPSNAGCNPGCVSSIVAVALPSATTEFGMHQLITGLAITGNHDYLIQVEAANSGNYINFCVGVGNPALNNTVNVPSIINNCGITFNGTTAKNYFPSATGNFDGNAGTTCGTCAAGADVPYAVNNDSWFKFCSTNVGTYNVQFKVNSCLFTGAVRGLQMAILTGTNTALTNIYMATNPTLPTTALQTSPNFALAAGGCAYLVVDGWNGDECTYSYVLTNVTGGCTLLPIELMSFNALQKDKVVELNWATATEINNNYFNIERSDDGINFKSIEVIKGSGTSVNAMFYSSIDYNPLPDLSYYRLKQTDFDGKSTYSKVISVNYINNKDLKFNIVPNPISENQNIQIRLGFIPKNDVSVLVYDINGLLIYNGTRKTDSITFEIPQAFSKGVYFVKLICNEFTETKRMLIK